MTDPKSDPAGRSISPEPKVYNQNKFDYLACAMASRGDVLSLDPQHGAF